MAERYIPAPDGSFGPFPGDVPESGRWPHPRPNHQDIERRQSGGLGDAPDDGGPKPVGPDNYVPARLR